MDMRNLNYNNKIYLERYKIFLAHDITILDNKN